MTMGFKNLFQELMDDHAVKSFDNLLSIGLGTHLQKFSIQSEIMMPGTFGHIHPHFVLWEDNVTIIASLKVINQLYDFIEITTRSTRPERGGVFYWINYIICVKTGEKRNLIMSEFNNNKGGRGWVSKAKFAPMSGIIIDAMRLMSKDEESEGTLAYKMNSDQNLMNAIHTMVLDKRFLDVFSSRKYPCCTYSQEIHEGYWPSKEDIDIAGRVSKHVRDFVPMTF